MLAASYFFYGWWDWRFLKIILPRGISFYTFQEVAHVVDVYFGKLEASFVDYSLFVSLFPHLIAGPIQRPGHLLPQVQRPRVFDPDKFFDGCMMIASGLFWKCVIADQCGLIANAAFDGKFGNNFMATLIGVFAFAWQIYGDFSGYSDFARGSAQLLGFHFMVNFRQPYLSASLQEFWRRWHISLSTWLRDYLYIPLGGNRGGSFQTYRNLMLTMLLGGLWHGANWTFVLWGAIHGVGLSLERALGGERVREAQEGFVHGTALWMRRLSVFAVVCFAWLFFRAKSLAEAGRMLSALGTWQWNPYFGTALTLLTVLSGVMMAMDLRMNRYDEEVLFERQPEMRRVFASLALLTGVILFSATQSNAFIYFQF